MVIYTSDHGEMLGEHGLWWKSSFDEPSTRIPLIAAWPGRFPAGSRVSTPVSLLDLTHTIVAAAGAVTLGGPGLTEDLTRPTLRDRHHPLRLRDGPPAPRRAQKFP